MPDTWARWGVDANGDGLPDPWNAEDAIYSAARYLAATGGATDISSAVFSYNHAQWYVDEVLQLAQQYAGGSADFGPALEAAQADLDAAKQAVLDANQRVLDAQAKVTELQARADELLQEATSEPLFSDRLATQKLATLADVDVQAAQAEVAARQSELQTAEDALSAARDQASGASFAPGSGQVLGSPSYSGGYVFPVARRRRRRQGRSHPPRLPGGRHRRPGRDAALRAVRRHRPGRLAASRTATAASASRSPPRTASSGRTAISPTSSRRSSQAPSWQPASPSGSSARRVMRQGRTCTSSCSPRPPTRRTSRGSRASRAPRSPGRTVSRRRRAPARSSRSSTRAPARRGRSTPPRGRSCCSRLRGLRSRHGSAERTSYADVRTAPRGADCRVAARNRGPDVRRRPEDLDPVDDARGDHDCRRAAGPPDGAGRPPPGLHLCQGNAQ